MGERDVDHPDGRPRNAYPPTGACSRGDQRLSADDCKQSGIEACEFHAQIPRAAPFELSFVAIESAHGNSRRQLRHGPAT